jgi:DNA mismatch repair protein MutS2
VITGPNTGGKTVILKTVGLLTLMTLVGSHIPAAEGSSLAVFTKVFADIGDEQSLQQNLSTFSAHMLPTIAFVQEVDPYSLVLLDEVGAGTDPSEGAALGIAILRVLTQREARTIVTTHHQALKTFAFSQAKMMNAAVEFDEKTLQPTYHFQMGRWGQSNALAVAETLGMPAEILNAAKEYLAGRSHWSELVGQQLQDTLRTVEQERKAIQQQQDTVQHLQMQYQTLVQELEKEKQQWRMHMRAEGEAILRAAQCELEHLVHALRQKGKEQHPVAFPKEQVQQIAEWVAAAFPREAPRHAGAPLPKGTVVAVPQWKLQGVVVEVSTDVVEIQCRGRIIKVPRSAVAVLPEGTIPEQEVSGKARKKRERTRFALTRSVPVEDPEPVSSELHLIGYRVEEALPQLEKYLDRVLQSGLQRVRIIHGKGSGRLRQAVWQFLQDHVRVKALAPCSPYEGGWGATAVELDT